MFILYLFFIEGFQRIRRELSLDDGLPNVNTTVFITVDLLQKWVLYTIQTPQKQYDTHAQLLIEHDCLRVLRLKEKQ